MKRLLICVVMAMGIHPVAWPCDACGSGMGGNGLGILTGFRQNSISLSLQRALYHASPEHGTSNDAFNVFGLSVRYHVSKRLTAQILQPVAFNVRKSADVTSRINGLADTRLLVVAVLFDKQRTQAASGLYLETGLGLKLPTGKFIEDTHARGVPENFSPGQGNVALLFQPAIVFTTGNMGLAWNTAIQLQTPSSNDYRYGHLGSTQVVVFRNVKSGKSTMLIPYLGAIGEVLGRDRYTSRLLVSGTGGRGLHALLGLQGVLGRVQAGASIALPLVQSYSGSQVLADNRQTFILTYTF